MNISQYFLLIKGQWYTSLRSAWYFCLPQKRYCSLCSQWYYIRLKLPQGNITMRSIISLPEGQYHSPQGEYNWKKHLLSQVLFSCAYRPNLHKSKITVKRGLYKCKSVSVDNRRVIIADKVFFLLPTVYYGPFTDWIGAQCFLVNHITGIFFISEHVLDCICAPFIFSS